MTTHAPRSLFDREIVITAIGDSFKQLSPRHLAPESRDVRGGGGQSVHHRALRRALVRPGGESPWFIFAISLWLWFTVLFANFAEAMAEGRGRAQAAELRKTRQTVLARRLKDPDDLKEIEAVAGNDLKRGDLVIVAAGEVIPGDGEIIARRRERRRKRDHRRERTSDPRGRRRPERGHRRHAGAVRLAHHSHHDQSRARHSSTG